MCLVTAASGRRSRYLGRGEWLVRPCCTYLPILVPIKVGKKLVWFACRNRYRGRGTRYYYLYGIIGTYYILGTVLKYLEVVGT